MILFDPLAGRRVLTVLALTACTAACVATPQTPAPDMPAAPQTSSPSAPQSSPASAGASVTPAPEPVGIAALAWLEGCWRGTVNRREFREEWLPLRGGMLVGVTQTVMQGKTQDYAYLRIEPAADGSVQYVTLTPGQPELRF